MDIMAEESEALGMENGMVPLIIVEPVVEVLHILQKITIEAFSAITHPIRQRF